MNYLCSIYWKTYNIGSLYKEEKTYYFMYNQKEVANATKEGFDYLVGFPNLDEVYISDKLFPFFKSRITYSSRHKNKLNLDPIDRLLEMEGKLMTDNYRIVKDKVKKYDKTDL